MARSTELLHLVISTRVDRATHGNDGPTLELSTRSADDAASLGLDVFRAVFASTARDRLGSVWDAWIYIGGGMTHERARAMYVLISQTPFDGACLR